MATTSKNINLRQLDNELGSKGLVANFTDPNNKIILPAENSDITETELQNAIDLHIAIDEEAAKAEAKAALLAQLGITEEQAKLLLS